MTQSAKTARFKLTDVHRGWLFVSPALLFLILLYGYPLVSAAVISFLRGGKWLGLANYLEAFTDRLFWLSLRNTAIFTMSTVIAQLLIGLGLALLLNANIRQWVLSLARGLLIIPWVIASVVAAGIWMLLFHSIGILNYALTSVGILKDSVAWLGDTRYALFAVILVNTWKYYPIYMVILLSGLKAIPTELYEAATMDGARYGQSFWFITLPALRGIIVFLSLMTSVWAFRHFDLVYLMTGGGPLYQTELLTNYVYHLTFQRLRFEYGSAISVIMLFICLIVSVFYLRLYRKGE